MGRIVLMSILTQPNRAVPGVKPPHLDHRILRAQDVLVERLLVATAMVGLCCGTYSVYLNQELVKEGDMVPAWSANRDRKRRLR
jgi:hypothetical protein